MGSNMNYDGGRTGCQRPVCRDAGLCGGCSYQGVDYADQLKNKEGEVRGLLRRKNVGDDVILPIEPAPSRYGYRNKMEYTFGDMEKGGPVTLGMHRKGCYMSIIDVEQCQLVHEDFNIILKAVLKFVHERGYSRYHKKSHRGLLRNLVLRRGVRTGEILVNIVTTSEGEDVSYNELYDECSAADGYEPFDEEGFRELIEGLELDHQVAGVLRTINDRFSDAVCCDELRVLSGRDYYEEEIMGLKFQVSAFSFFQTNVDAVENLYRYALGLMGDLSGRKVFDLYSGTGTITQVLAGKASEAVGIEIVEDAVECARKAAALNGLDNCRFISGDVFKVLDSMDEKPDMVVVDPPRAGMSPDALEKMIGYGLGRIVYISCNPKTLADNLYYLQYNGYTVESVKPFDNFPFTRHVETVALLSKLDVNKHIDVE